MMKKLLSLMILCVMMFSGANVFAEDDEFSFDNFAIVEDDAEDMNIENVSLNSGADIVNVRQFDLAGIMLGMSYDEVHNLFFGGSGLYAPRRKNSVIYTINQDWKYNLDYECRQNKIYQPERLEKCIYSLARNRGLLYVSEIHL